MSNAQMTAIKKGVPLTPADPKKEGFMGGMSEETAQKLLEMHEENKKIMASMEPEILVKYHSDASRPVKQAHMGEWFDLRAAEDMVLKQGQRYMINLGVSIAVPHGYEAILAPRSSTFKNWGIIQTNGVGVIDNSYSGDNDIWMMPVWATRDAEIKAGDRVAQFRIQRNQGSPQVKEVRYLGNTDRGGFGSTGVQ